MSQGNRRGRERGPAITPSLYSIYVQGQVAEGLPGARILTQEDFYDLPSAMRRHLAQTSDPTFHTKNGITKCVKKV
jgi:hypothetical protein